VWAKRRFKTPEKYLRAKYKREFELNEKIVSNTLWARLEANGRLVVGAVAKRQPPPATQPPQPLPETQPPRRPPATQPPPATQSSASTSTAGVSDRNDTAAAPAAVAFPPPLHAAAECPDILVTCPDTVRTVDNGRRTSADND